MAPFGNYYVVCIGASLGVPANHRLRSFDIQHNALFHSKSRLSLIGERSVLQEKNQQFATSNLNRILNCILNRILNHIDGLHANFRFLGNRQGFESWTSFLCLTLCVTQGNLCVTPLALIAISPSGGKLMESYSPVFMLCRLIKVDRGPLLELLHLGNGFAPDSTAF